MGDIVIEKHRIHEMERQIEQISGQIKSIKKKLWTAMGKDQSLLLYRKNRMEARKKRLQFLLKKLREKAEADSLGGLMGNAEENV